MAAIRRVNWLRFLTRMGRILGPILLTLTRSLRDDLEIFLTDFYRRALETENPWDDFLAALLLETLGFDVPEDEE